MDSLGLSDNHLLYRHIYLNENGLAQKESVRVSVLSVLVLGIYMSIWHVDIITQDKN